jgi:hypothetical protein
MAKSRIFHEEQRISPRNSPAMPLKEVIQAMLKCYRIDRKFHAMQIVSSWKEIMGETVSRRTENVFVKNRVLYVKITSAPLKNEMLMAKSTLLERIHEHLGEDALDNIVFL